MAPPPFRVRSIGDVACHRIGYRVETESDEQGGTRERGRQSVHLYIKEQQEQRESDVLDALCSRAYAEAQLATGRYHPFDAPGEN